MAESERADLGRDLLSKIGPDALSAPQERTSAPSLLVIDLICFNDQLPNAAPYRHRYPPNHLFCGNPSANRPASSRRRLYLQDLHDRIFGTRVVFFKRPNSSALYRRLSSSTSTDRPVENARRPDPHDSARRLCASSLTLFHDRHDGAHLRRWRLGPSRLFYLEIVLFDVLDGASGLNAIERAKDDTYNLAGSPLSTIPTLSTHLRLIIRLPPSTSFSSSTFSPTLANLDLDSLQRVNITSFFAPRHLPTVPDLQPRCPRPLPPCSRRTSRTRLANLPARRPSPKHDQQTRPASAA
ncbi:uncharacterized protein RHOBADRAFT_54341 [Rhodotorula graminis WP1]|uniref:Uncharacterized protein n=1 Tax=Rhodotorula graminis (strain WP1) TaxID=578459 RepID=A0A194S1Y1_RHOGW|nr:uncharacterized protein RHOBADRAFT_54341 [Rhodotorula graminis WP1]KPV74535.1 hypothetical protein RHOBADRAFT_54341 [Rhodotorula graminis WP1]